MRTMLVLRMDSRSLVIDQGRSNVTVARAQVDSMFRRGSYAKEATVGLGFFGALGGGLAAMSFSQAMCGGDASCPSGDAINAFGGGAVAGGLLGALTGALIGSAMEKTPTPVAPTQLARDGCHPTLRWRIAADARTVARHDGDPRTLERRCFGSSAWCRLLPRAVSSALPPR